MKKMILLTVLLICSTRVFALEKPFATCSRADGFAFESYDIYLKDIFSQKNLVRLTIRQAGNLVDQKEFPHSSIDIGPSWNDYTIQFSEDNSDYKIIFSNSKRDSEGTIKLNDTIPQKLNCTIIDYP